MRIVMAMDWEPLEDVTETPMVEQIQEPEPSCLARILAGLLDQGALISGFSSILP